MNSLDEAITNERETAEMWREKAEEFKLVKKPKFDCIKCAEDHEQLAAWLTELKERREADRWIRVDEALPEKKGWYLVFTDYGDVTIDSFVDGMFVCHLWSVTHWKPFPKAPESEDK